MVVLKKFVIKSLLFWPKCLIAIMIAVEDIIWGSGSGIIRHFYIIQICYFENGKFGSGSVILKIEDLYLNPLFLKLS